MRKSCPDAAHWACPAVVNVYQDGRTSNLSRGAHLDRLNPSKSIHIYCCELATVPISHWSHIRCWLYKAMEFWSPETCWVHSTELRPGLLLSSSKFVQSPVSKPCSSSWVSCRAVKGPSPSQPLPYTHIRGLGSVQAKALGGPTLSRPLPFPQRSRPG